MAEIIHTPLTVLHVVACAFLILVILIQPGKSGGMGIFGAASTQQVFGGRGAGNFLTKTTWATAALFFTTSITLAYLSSSSDESLADKAKAMAEKRPGDDPSSPAPASSK
jgi:preprotein translocase subunit SecG